MIGSKVSNYKHLTDKALPCRICGQFPNFERDQWRAVFTVGCDNGCTRLGIKSHTRINPNYLTILENLVFLWNKRQANGSASLYGNRLETAWE